MTSTRHENEEEWIMDHNSELQGIQRLDRHLAYEGTVLNFYKDDVRIPTGEVQAWDFIEHKIGGGAAVVPVLPDGRIIMVKQYRPAIDSYTLEIPAGAHDDPEEDSLVTAARELEEETGYRAGRLIKLSRIHTAVAWCNETTDIYLALDLEPVGAQKLDDAEEIHVVEVSLEDALADIRSGKQTDAKTVAGILGYYQTLADAR